jgi:NAD(P)-dependent dehydrogenase (short-subunit alcohol dehydrogenase family)
MAKDYFGYKRKKVVITGAASGMGKSATEMLIDLGAEVYALDVKEVPLPVKEYISTNLLKKDSIDAAVKKLPAKIECIFNCAGVPGATYKGSRFSPADVVTINFLAARHLIEKLIPRMSKGGAIAIISSMGGMGWPANLETDMQLLQTKDFDEGRAWLEANKDNPKAIAGPPETNPAYPFSKECLIVYAKARAFELAAKNIRINTVSPGATQTGMSADFDALYGKETIRSAVSPIGRIATAEEPAQAIVFLNSDMASYISGVDLLVDYGFSGAASIGMASLPEIEK